MDRVHQWDPGKPAVCPCYQQQNETYAHMQLSCPQLHDAITKAHDQARKPMTKRSQVYARSFASTCRMRCAIGLA